MQPNFDCSLRSVVFNRSLALLQPPVANPSAIYAALRLGECGHPTPVEQRPVVHFKSPCSFDKPAALKFHVSPDDGSDLDGDGTATAPFATLHRARDARAAAQNKLEAADIVLHAGTHRLAKPLLLSAADSHTRFVACERGTAIVSGASSMTLTFSRGTDTNVWHAPTPKSLTNVEQLFLVPSPDVDAVGQRLVWAREPNGNAETDLQPIGYALAQDNPLGAAKPPAGAGAWRAIRTDKPKRNSTSFPGFGFDRDPRRPGTGYIALHTGSYAALYEDGRNFWNQTFPAGLRWNATPGATSHGFNVSVFNATGWPSAFQQKPWLHAMHHSEWGHHTWEVDGVDVEKRTFKLGKGGWQEARYIVISKNPFYVEGAYAALDQPGEWFHEESSSTLYLIPNATIPNATRSIKLTLAVPTLETLVNVSGSEGEPAHDLTFEGLTFTHTKRTLLEPYLVPSGGDWSVRGSGAVAIRNAEDIAIKGCIFNRTGGHAIVLRGGVLRGSIVGNEMDLLGDSGVVLIGELPGLGNNGSDRVWKGGLPTVPRDTLIESNHFHGLGVWGKQSAALFQALSCRTNFTGNVAYNGPRAAININDGYCGGTTLSSNVLFNWVRETQDHGPINTWDRQTYAQPDDTLYPRWNRVVRNLIMNGPSGNRDLGNLFPAVDNDDGSAYYEMSSNAVAYGGFKNFLGNDKIWRENLILYPNGRTVSSGNGPCIMAWGGKNELYANNTCVTRGAAGPGVDPYPWGAEGKGCDFANKTMRPILLHLAHNTYLNKAASFGGACGRDLKGLNAIGEEIGSNVGKEPAVSELMAMVWRVLS